MQELTLHVYHKSLKGLTKEDDHGNDPFWMRVSALDTLDVLTDDYKPIISPINLVVVYPFTVDVYGLKQGYLVLEIDGILYRFIFNDSFFDYDIQPFIEKNKCWFKECEIKKEENE